ncbi:tetratricopeptide repeat protein [Verrucomicrobiota bacterium sgz303538]
MKRQLQALESKGESLDTLSRRGDLQLFLNHPREAVSAFEKMIAIDPQQDAPHWRLGIAYYFAGEFAKSAKQFEKYHAYDGRDRENGVWKFLAQARVDGVEKARHEMLAYKDFDREPFPSLYEMFAGKRSGDDVLAEIERKQLTSDSRVMFFAHYYVGLNEELLEKRESALEHLRKAVALFTPETAGSGGPGYMWQVARVHLARMSKK